jgi:hypothetical protein
MEGGACRFKYRYAFDIRKLNLLFAKIKRNSVDLMHWRLTSGRGK